MQLIIDWLDGKRNFIVGRALYKRFGHDNGLKALLAKGETIASRSKLSAALAAMVSDKVSSAEAVVVAVAPPPIGVKPKPESDDVTLALDAQWKPLYKRMQMLRNDMFARWGTDNSEAARAACKDYCMEILDLEQQCMVIWAKRDYYLQHGHLPDEPYKKDEEIPTEPLHLARFIEKCARTIRRYRYSALTNPKHAAIRERHKLLYEKAAGRPYTEKDLCAEE